jgi:hypothetical protein
MAKTEKLLFDKFLEVLAAFSNFKVKYILIGGVAVIIRGMERLTRDIDVMLKLEKENIERLRQALDSVFHDTDIQQITLEELRKYAVIRYGTPEGFCIDLMTKIGEVFAYEDIHAESLKLGSISINISTIESLIKMKKDTLRLQDKMDANFLSELLQRMRE